MFAEELIGQPQAGTHNGSTPLRRLRVNDESTVMYTHTNTSNTYKLILHTQIAILNAANQINCAPFASGTKIEIIVNIINQSKVVTASRQAIAKLNACLPLHIGLLFCPVPSPSSLCVRLFIYFHSEEVAAHQNVIYHKCCENINYP